MFRAGRRTIFCGVNEVFEGLNDTPERRGLTRSAISSSRSLRPTGNVSLIALLVGLINQQHSANCCDSMEVTKLAGVKCQQLNLVRGEMHLAAEEIRIGRLIKKIEKLKK